MNTVRRPILRLRSITVVKRPNDPTVKTLHPDLNLKVSAERDTVRP
jgi:hypothetical protein